MAALRLDDIARTTGGAILQGPAGLSFTSYGIDSRRTVAGGLYFAIPAERDGHDFVAAAAAAGAAGAVVSRPVDVPEGHRGAGAISQIIDLGLLALDAEGRFLPENPVTPLEALTVLSGLSRIILPPS